MKFILGKKIGMTQVFADNGDVIPVTRVVAGPCQVVQVKDVAKKNNATALQLGFGTAAEFRLPKPKQGHVKGLNTVLHLKDFGIEKVDGVERGDTILVDTFNVGDVISVIGKSKGKGFAGVVKRHHFKGAPKSHGHKHDLRAPGSIGAGGVQRVFKGMRMAGRMGGDRVTVKNLKIVAVHPESNELYIKGAVPGGRNSILMIMGDGELKITKQQTAPAQTEAAPAVAETVAAGAQV